MAALFHETDDIIRLGKWAYLGIPGGERCGRCPLVGTDVDRSVHIHWYCGLRPAYSLTFDLDGPFKDDTCPRREE